MNQPDTETQDAPSSAGRPSGTTMSLISVILFAHLFLVLAALSSNLRPWNSEVQTSLVERFASYLKTLALDPEFRKFHLTHGTAQEDNHIIRIELKASATSPVDETVVVPLAGNRFLPDHHRFLSLARKLGEFAESDQDARAAQLAKAVGSHFLHLLDDSRHAVVRCLRVESQPMLLSDLTDGFPTDPTDAEYEQAAYAADVFLTEDGQVLVGKISSARESAGAVPGRNGQ